MGKKPDNVADNPGIVTYGTNVSAPAIVLPDFADNKKQETERARQKLKAKLEELQQEYENLIQQAEDNETIYSAECRFVPLMNKHYYLYVREDGTSFISLVGPHECDWTGFSGTFRQQTSGLWERV